jgi:CheY-like chemotaxis protein
MPKTILVIDDEPDAVEFVKEILEGAGHTVISEANGRDGLASVRADNPDLVILDVQMPGMNGFEVFGQMRKDQVTKSVPVIMLTGIREKAGIGFTGKDMGEYYGEPPQAYVEKPVNPAVLLDTVSKILG